MQIVHQDILTVKNAIICHQVNHQGIMGGGLALQIKNKYPRIMEGYRYWCEHTTFDRLKHHGAVYYYETQDGSGNVIANIFGQEKIGYGLQTDYDALYAGLAKVFMYSFWHNNMDIAIPYKIGCGLAGGDWQWVKKEIIKPLIKIVPQIKTTIYYKFENDLEEEDK
jgi:O-acetyl-ADP-ribose deacetylase (regulator of RNase III)